MTEYIERDECREEFYNSVLCILSEDSTNDRANQIIDAFDDLPVADVQPVKHGQWIPHGSLPANIWHCSECKGLVEVAHYCNKCYYDFCPKCGAKMDKE